jgi:hypothetical protein
MHCTACIFWENYHSGIGYCHRYAPKPGDDYKVPLPAKGSRLGDPQPIRDRVSWPETNCMDFCGEFQGNQQYRDDREDEAHWVNYLRSLPFGFDTARRHLDRAKAKYEEDTCPF